MYWAMRTTRDSTESRNFVTKELLAHGRLRQGWGSDKKQDLRCIHDAWSEERELTPKQIDASRHWRMADNPAGHSDDYMNVGDIVLVPNMPDDGLFTLCRVTGAYNFDIPSGFDGDFGHIRPVEVLTPGGVANEHRLVIADLRRSLRCRSRLWSLAAYADCIEEIVKSDLPAKDLAKGVTSLERTESLITSLTSNPVETMAHQLTEHLQLWLQGAEWEKVIASGLEPLFPTSVHHTGGSGEQGADLEITISNPFEESNDWIVPVQIKDHQGKESAEKKVISQLERAYLSRMEFGRVIAVVLMVTYAEPDSALKMELSRLTCKHGVPFIYCGKSDLMQMLARGFLKQKL